MTLTNRTCYPVFHNTTMLTGIELKKEQNEAQALQKRVLKFYQDRGIGQGWIWSDISTELGLDIQQCKSVSRCLTNLSKEVNPVTNKPFLYKSKNTKKSIFGGKSHYYFLNW